MAHRLILIDDHELAHSAMRMLLTGHSEVVVDRCFREAGSGIAHVAEHGADLMLLDLELPDLDGVQVLEKMVDEYDMPVIVLTGVTKPLILARCQRAGARGIVSKGDPVEETLKAVDCVIEGKSYLSPSVEKLLAGLDERHEPIELSERQSEILAMVGEGVSNKEISYRLDISQPTVSFHLGELRRKLGASHSRQLVELAKDAGLL